MTLHGPFQIQQFDIDATSLEQTDLGKWALIVTGCYQLFDSKCEAQSTYDSLVLQDGRA